MSKGVVCDYLAELASDGFTEEVIITAFVILFMLSFLKLAASLFRIRIRHFKERNVASILLYLVDIWITISILISQLINLGCFIVLFLLLNNFVCKNSEEQSMENDTRKDVTLYFDVAGTNVSVFMKAVRSRVLLPT